MAHKKCWVIFSNGIQFYLTQSLLTFSNSESNIAPSKKTNDTAHKKLDDASAKPIIFKWTLIQIPQTSQTPVPAKRLSTFHVRGGGWLFRLRIFPPRQGHDVGSIFKMAPNVSATFGNPPIWAAAAPSVVAVIVGLIYSKLLPEHSWKREHYSF